MFSLITASGLRYGLQFLRNLWIASSRKSISSYLRNAPLSTREGMQSLRVITSLENFNEVAVFTRLNFLATMLAPQISLPCSWHIFNPFIEIMLRGKRKKGGGNLPTSQVYTFFRLKVIRKLKGSRFTTIFLLWFLLHEGFYPFPKWLQISLHFGVVHFREGILNYEETIRRIHQESFKFVKSYSIKQNWAWEK